MGLGEGHALRVLSVVNDSPLQVMEKRVELQQGAGMAVMDALTSRLLPTENIGQDLLFRTDLTPGETRRYLLIPRQRLPAIPPALPRGPTMGALNSNKMD